ncbi:hypothetical protein ASPVEDRAFT_39195 [Aspergillus versicolor CBS 583.65]|uniref:Uncharacterized protein n=1 Tax=Aspergillus versicolor CBS 583.65 TaxID=1036611 RepID=A0A1L9PED9_ASPVE|nr:uncharacterized protein ASPVEDRAFT_39195 [Aspergillus versicolor CBS 583.65]OJI99835.1 hypothetical protein ASPVEDRAFT_39195 [Aspergillus versicolor CBS 583.65]
MRQRCSRVNLGYNLAGVYSPSATPLYPYTASLISVATKRQRPGRNSNSSAQTYLLFLPAQGYCCDA